mgnify:CR=1 FL=1
MKIITVATEIHGYYNILLESAEKYQYELITLGMGEEWDGYTMKYKLMNDYLNSLPDDDSTNNEIIIFLDGYDTFILNEHELLLERYETFGKPLVFGSQWNRKTGDWWSRYIISTFSSGFKDVMNSGSYMGPVWALKKKFHMLCSQFDCNLTSQNDQKLLNKSRMLEPEFHERYVAIDKSGIIFHNAAYYSSMYYAPWFKNCILFNDIEIDKKDNKLLIRDTSIEPIFISGPGNVDLESYAEYKGLGEKVIKRPDNEYGFEFYKEYALELTIYYGGIGLAISIILLLLKKLYTTYF